MFSITYTVDPLDMRFEAAGSVAAQTRYYRSSTGSAPEAPPSRPVSAVLLRSPGMNHRLFRLFFAAFLALSLSSVPAWAQGNGKGKGKGHDKHQQGGDDDQGGAYEQYGFRDHDREVVTTYYSKHGSGLPPGLAKRNG